MDQAKIGSFLKALRKEKNLTQESLAEQLKVSNRTISRWETGSNMPDIGMLVEIAEFYDLGIPEIIKGERQSENMNRETKETAAAMAEYSRNEVKNGKQRVIGALLSAFGIFVILSALMIFPSESSWGSIYSVAGSIILVVGIYVLIRPLVAKRSIRIMTLIGCILLLFGVFTLSDYVAVRYFNQVPRFRCETLYDSRQPDRLVHKTLFFTVIQEHPGTKDQRVYIIKK